MHRRPSDRTLGLAVVSSETLLAVFGLTGLGPLLHPGRVVVGRNPSNDFQIMAWSLRFWPWAIEHGVAPRHTSLLWAPTGFSTLWLTTIPGPALAAAPLMLTARPIATYNVLVVVAIVVAGVAAYLLPQPARHLPPAFARAHRIAELARRAFDADVRHRIRPAAARAAVVVARAVRRHDRRSHNRRGDQHRLRRIETDSAARTRATDRLRIRGVPAGTRPGRHRRVLERAWARHASSSRFLDRRAEHGAADADRPARLARLDRGDHAPLRRQHRRARRLPRAARARHLHRGAASGLAQALACRGAHRRRGRARARAGRGRRGPSRHGFTRVARRRARA